METKRTLTEPKRIVRVGVLGHFDRDKTTLTVAITSVQFKSWKAKGVGYNNIDSAPEERARGITVNTAHLEYEIDNRHYTYVDYPGDTDYMKNMIKGAAQMDGAILVVSATDGSMPHTLKQILLANILGITHIIIYLNKCELIEDEEILKTVEEDIKELLTQHNFPGNTTPIIRGSALEGYEGKNTKYGIQSIVQLLRTMDDYIPTPIKDVDLPFLMAIEDIFPIKDRGTIVTGRIESGTIKIGDKIEIVGLRDSQTTTVTGIEMFRKTLNEGRAGDNVGIVTREKLKEDFERGMVLAKPDSITAHVKFKAIIYVLGKNEEDKHMPFFHGYKPQFYIRTSEVTGEITEVYDKYTGSPAEIVIPGDDVQIIVNLKRPIAMQKRTKFEIREGGRKVGFGVVTEILD